MGSTTERTEHNKKEILEALEKTLGNVTSACKMVGIGRTTFYDWMNNDEEFKKEVDDIQNVTLDYVEGKLINQIRQDNVTSIIFYLKTKGKGRGYVERQEIQTDGFPNKIQVEVIDEGTDQ
jgi:hypothetical protein